MSAKMNVPELRFKEFSGEWEESELREIGKITTGSTPSTSVSEYFDGNKMFVSPTDIQGNRFINSTKTTLTDLGFSKGRKVSKNSVCFVCIGSTIGKVAQLSEDSLTNQQINCVTANENNFDDFVYSLLELKASRIKLLAGEQAVPQINKSDFSKLKFFIPSKPEQEKIASFLSSVDTKIEQLTKKKTLLEQYKKGVMQKIFSQEIRFRDDDGGEYPEWVERKLGDAFKIGSGKDYKHLSSGDIPVYGTGGYMLSVSDYLYEGESVCIGRKGTIDKPMFLDGKFWTVDTLFYTHSFKDSIPKFIFYIFQTINWKLYNEASGVPSLSKSTIEKIDFLFPSINEQTKIANFLTSLDTKISQTEQQLESTKQFKKALLQKMFV